MHPVSSKFRNMQMIKILPIFNIQEAGSEIKVKNLEYFHFHLNPETCPLRIYFTYVQYSTSNLNS